MVDDTRDADLLLRPACDADAWDLIGLIAACWAEYPGLVLDVHGEAPWLLAPATAYAKRSGRLWVVAECGRVVASGGFVPSAGCGGIELRTLYVARPYRERRLGGRLLALVEEEARRRGLAFVDLWTDAKFLDAQRFYERRGYRRGPTRVMRDRSRSVEFYYRKDLWVGEGVHGWSGRARAGCAAIARGPMGSIAQVARSDGVTAPHGRMVQKGRQL